MQVGEKVAHGMAAAKTLYIDQIIQVNLVQFLEEAQIYQKLSWMIQKYSINNVCFTKQLTNNSCLPNPKLDQELIEYIPIIRTPATGAVTGTYMCRKRQIIKDCKAEKAESWS